MRDGKMDGVSRRDTRTPGEGRNAASAAEEVHVNEFDPVLPSAVGGHDLPSSLHRAGGRSVPRRAAAVAG